MVDVHWYHGMKLSDVERLVIIRAYTFYGRNKTKTAEGLGICIRTLDARLEEYGLKATPEGNEHLMEIVKKRSRKPRVTKPHSTNSETVKKFIDAHKHVASATPPKDQDDDEDEKDAVRDNPELNSDEVKTLDARLEKYAEAQPTPLADAVNKFMTYGPK